SKMKLLFCGLCVFLFVFTMNFNEVSSILLPYRYPPVNPLPNVIIIIYNYL
ncbi:hypothetical protein Avbf_10224, partial [Armadillidium vulgare]